MYLEKLKRKIDILRAFGKDKAMAFHLDEKPDYQNECSECGNVPTMPLNGFCAKHTIVEVCQGDEGCIKEIQEWVEKAKKYKGNKQRKLI